MAEMLGRPEFRPGRKIDGHHAADVSYRKVWSADKLIVGQELNLASSQHTEPLFKSILGNCQAVVGHLSSLRNKLGDSHGQGKGFVRPKARHAELAVNLAGTVATFLISTWSEGKGNAP
jgi:hypothetical protein